MIATFLIVLAILTLIHFLYESVIAPSLRFSLRLKLFALRDDLRTLKIERGAELSDEVFLDLQDTINGAVLRLKHIDLSLLKAANEAIEHDEKLKKRVRQRIAMFEASPVSEIREIRRRSFDLIDHALAINSGGLLLYLVPIVIGFFFADRARALVVSVFSLPENDLNKIAPPPSEAVA